jgi:hypothetical protein
MHTLLRLVCDTAALRGKYGNGGSVKMRPTFAVSRHECVNVIVKCKRI